MSDYNTDVLIRAISQYLGVAPKARYVRHLPKEEFDRRYNMDYGRITGMAGAITLPGNKIYIREGSESSALHEMIHTAGFQYLGCESSVVNEGMTQLATIEIGKKLGLRPHSGYVDEIRIASDIINAAGVPKRTFLRGYAKASDKYRYISDLLWKKHHRKFRDVDDWGPAERVRKAIYSDLKNLVGYSIYLEEMLKTKKK
jgi:hypothetical protein